MLLVSSRNILAAARFISKSNGQQLAIMHNKPSRNSNWKFNGYNKRFRWQVVGLSSVDLSGAGLRGADLRSAGLRSADRAVP